MPPADNFIFWCAPARKEEEEDVTFEDTLPPELELVDDPSEKGKGRESMYVSLVECKPCPRGSMLARDSLAPL